MIFPERVFGMSATMRTWRGRAIAPIAATMCSLIRAAISSCVRAGFERDESLGQYAFHGIPYAHHRRLGNAATGKACGFELLGAQPMASHVDDIVNPPENAVVAVFGTNGAVAGKIRPVAPVLACRITVVARVIGFHEAFVIAPDREHTPGPGIADAEIPRLARAGGLSPRPPRRK